MRGVLDPYPPSDGLVLQGTMWHEAPVRLLHEALDRRFSGREDLTIASELVLYYEPAPIGGRVNSVIPDLMVVSGVLAHGRSAYKIWEGGSRAPQFALEVASGSTVDRDCGFKKGEDERLGDAGILATGPDRRAAVPAAPRLPHGGWLLRADWAEGPGIGRVPGVPERGAGSIVASETLPGGLDHSLPG